jgi:hypothetical protein
MLNRRIVTSVCALCFAIPATAGASPAQGPYGLSTAAAPQDGVKAKGPYGLSTATAPQDGTGAKAPLAASSGRGGVNGWRTAAISEAALLAAFALGAALLLSARRRAPRMGL